MDEIQRNKDSEHTCKVKSKLTHCFFEGQPSLPLTAKDSCPNDTINPAGDMLRLGCRFVARARRVAVLGRASIPKREDTVSVSV